MNSTSNIYKFSGEVYESDIEKIANEIIALPIESVENLVPIEISLPRINVSTIPNLKDGKSPNSIPKRSIYFLGQYTLTSIIDFRQHLEENLHLVNDKINSRTDRKIWLYSLGNLIIPGSNLRADDIEVAITPSKTSSTGYTIRGQ